jgi:phosphatidate phosphatase PAH1
MFNIF